ncbi:MAG: hypothetical protein ACYC4Q_11855 [Victivallaceae bacterium]
MKLLEIYHDKIIGAIKGLDRIRFRGTLRGLSDSIGINMFMSATGLLLKDFKDFAEARTQALRASCERRADELSIPRIYLNSSNINKEEEARSVAAKNGVVNGPICLFSVVEPCMAPIVKGNRKTRQLELKMIPRKCTFLYHYFDHPEVGFGHVRIQTWMPYQITICLNGRHWLEKQLIKRNCDFVKDGNCFPWIADLDLAQRLMDTQLEMNWSDLLNHLLYDASPEHSDILHPVYPKYYWSADETEYATDIMFRSPHDLERLYPSFIKHAMTVSDSPAVMRFFGRKEPRGVFPKEIITDCRRRYEGVRIKSWVNFNSVKMYNKADSILRIETTINNTRDFKVYRHPDDNPDKPASWQKMRKGVADLHRRCQVSDQCNIRYADAIATANTKEKLQNAVLPVCNRIIKNGQRFRALNPWRADDFQLVTFLGKGGHAINGFRNHDLVAFLFGSNQADDEKEKRRRSGVATRRIRLLRAHGLIRKVPRVNRYVVTDKGQKFATALLSASNVEIEKLMEMAA